jgi:hypothetical protein
MLSPTLLGVIICVTAVILEGALAGKGCSSAAGAASHAALFPSIRTLACYRFPVLCDVLYHFAPHAHRWLASHSQVFALVLTIVLLPANALWSVLFFR